MASERHAQAQATMAHNASLRAAAKAARAPREHVAAQVAALRKTIDTHRTTVAATTSAHYNTTHSGGDSSSSYSSSGGDSGVSSYKPQYAVGAFRGAQPMYTASGFLSAASEGAYKPHGIGLSVSGSTPDDVTGRLERDAATATQQVQAEQLGND
jgi:hypothetical protein